MTQTDGNISGYSLAAYRQVRKKAIGVNVVASTSEAAGKGLEDGPSASAKTTSPLHEQPLAPPAPPVPVALLGTTDLPQCPGLCIYDTDGNLHTPIWPGSDGTIPRTFEEVGKRSKSQNNDLHLAVSVNGDDAYSEASTRFRANRALHETGGWAGRQGYGSDSDTEGVIAKGDDNDVYDSDLDSLESRDGVRPSREHARKMRKWKSLATNRFENMLLECIVNIDNIPPRYENMFIATSIIQQLERVTKLSLERVKAFSHGVLKGNRVTGAILWGPPGTGKSLLAKGLARESGYNMLCISTAELWQKCHGEDEKVIKAVFSMGRKLHPCIIFIDEADALLGARKAGEKRHIRSMLNQFLLEWDGLMSGDHMPFVLLATNRPFDLDPAVLRRAPVHIKLDVPRLEDRRQILQLLLRGENLEQDRGIDMIGSLARQTHNYTGSDLKNLCVSAATLCVQEQNEDTDERALSLQHFYEAMNTVRPTALNRTMENEFRKFGREAGSSNARPEQEEE